MELQKVHITIDERVSKDPVAAGHALEKLQSETQLGNVDLPRFARFGIVSGDIPAENIARVRGFSFVEDVELDGVKRVIVRK